MTLLVMSCSMNCIAMHPDTVMLAEEMNQYHGLSPHPQYDFYYYGVLGSSLWFPKKPVDHLSWNWQGLFGIPNRRH